MLAKKLLLGMMIMFIAVSFAWAQSQTEYVLPAPTEFIQYKDGSGNITYDTEAGYKIGRYDESGYEIRYRTRFEFSFSAIPKDAKINWVKITFSIDGSSSYKAKIVKVSNTYYSYSEGWTQIQNSGTVYFDNLSYNQSYIDKINATLTSDVTSAIQSDDQKLCLGTMSLNESTNLTEADLVVDYITVNYTPKVQVTIRNSFAGGTVEVDGSIQTSPWTSPSTGSSVWYSGDSHTIRAYTQEIDGLTHPFPEPGTWTINGGQQTQVNNNTPISISPYEDCTCTANFDEAGYEVTVYQKLSNGTEVGAIGHWEDGPNFVSYTAPKTFLFEIPSTQVIRSAQEIISGEKYNNWSIDSDVKNHHIFNITQNTPSLIISNFKQITGDITINVNLSGTHTIQFKDPWFIDYADPNYGNHYRNRGSDAVYRTRTSPFTIDYSTAYENGQSYKGVFLNQNPRFDPTIPIYRLKAPRYVNDSGIYSIFRHWTTTGSSSFESSGSVETNVCFKDTNPVVAEYWTDITVTGGTLGYDADGFYVSLTGNRIYATESDIYEAVWSTSDNSKAQIGSGDVDKCYVTFSGSNVTISANYVSANATGRTVTVSSEETLTLPPNATYNITPGNFGIDVYGALIINQSTLQPVIFQSNAAGPSKSDWNGIKTHNGSTLLLRNVTLKNAKIHRELHHR